MFLVIIVTGLLTGWYFFWFLSMNLPDDDNQWLKHGAVAVRSDAFGDSQGSKKNKTSSFNHADHSFTI